MKYEHTREHMLPVIVELTYEDLLILRKMAKSLLDMETLPDVHGYMYTGDIRRLEREVTEAINKVAQSVKYSFPVTEGTD
jgi:hypothetical protein